MNRWGAEAIQLTIQMVLLFILINFCARTKAELLIMLDFCFVLKAKQSSKAAEVLNE